MKETIIDDILTVIICVNYSDYLEQTLQHHNSILKNLFIITDKNDSLTKKLAEKFSFSLLKTNRFYKDGATFNKGLVLNDFLIKNLKNQWILLLDADIFLPINLFEILSHKILNKNFLYSVDRVCIDKQNCTTSDINKEYISKMLDQETPFSGYFQLFHGSKFLYKNNKIVYPISFSNAATSDMYFIKAWKEKERFFLKGLNVIHIGPRRINWNGRISDKVNINNVKDWHNLFCINVSNPYVKYI